MSESARPATGTLPPTLARRVDEACNRFEVAWKAGPRPRIEDFLGGWPEPERAALLRELLLLEVFYRRETGEDCPAQEYQARFPELDALSLAQALAPCGKSSPVEGPNQEPQVLAAALRGQQRACWRRGERVLVETYLEHHPALRGDFDAVLDLICSEMMLREEQGDPPQLEEYEARFPQLAAQLHDQFAVHRVIEGGLGSVVVPTQGSLSGNVGEPAPSEGAADRGHVPGYVILGELGRGGMGVVYQARHVTLNRVVALKMILAGSHAGEHELARFQTEAEALARLQHPNIVQIYEVGEHEGRPFFALEFVEGGGLDRSLNGTPQPARAAGQLVETLARAVQAAHRCGIIHRDLKPANILLTADNVPKVMDFGLAKQLDVAVGRTQSGAIMGTPSYMAPEQAEGKSKSVGPAADVYALGAILYECLTGRPPFLAETPLETLFQVIADEPVPPCRLRPKVPRDLETICLKCLEKQPAQRYPTAAALAEDLQRFLNEEPIQARSVSVGQRVWKWAKRQPATAVLLLVSGVAAAALGAFVVGQVYRAELEGTNARLQDALREADRAKENDAEQKTQTHEALEKVGRYLYFQRIALAERAFAAHDLGRAGELLRECPAPFRNWEWSYLAGVTHVPCTTRRPPTGLVHGAAYSRDGKRLALAGDDHTVRVRDETPFHEKDVVLRGHTAAVTGVAFSPDGQHLASAGEDRTVRIWLLTNQMRAFMGKETAQARLCFTLQEHTGPVRCVAYSPDGRFLASAGDDGTVKVWDAAKGQGRSTLVGHERPVRSVAFSPDGKQLASGGDDRTVKVWDAATGRACCTLRHTGRVVGVAFHGDRLAAATAEPGQSGQVKVWRVATREEVLTLRGHAGGITCVAFRPDGQRLATGGTDHTVRFWEAATGQMVLLLRGHADPIACLAWQPDGRSLVSVSGRPGKRAQVKTWGLPPRADGRVIRGHEGMVAGVAFSPDGERLASAGSDGTVRVWDLSLPHEQGVPTAREIFSLSGHGGPVLGVAIGPDGQRLAAADSEGTVTVWDVTSGKKFRVLRGHSGPVHSVAFHPDGQRLAAAGGRPGQPGEVKLWEVETGKELLDLRGHTGPVLSISFRGDGQQLASAGSDQIVKIWDTTSGREPLTLHGHTGAVTGVAFSPDGRLLASGSYDKTVRIWDAASGKPVHVLRGDMGEVTGVTFSRDGGRLFSAGTDGTVKVWDPLTGLEACTLRGHADGVTGVAFSLAGHQRVACANVDGTLKIWETARYQDSLDEIEDIDL